MAPSLWKYISFHCPNSLSQLDFPLCVATKPPASHERGHCFPPGPPPAGCVEGRLSTWAYCASRSEQLRGDRARGPPGHQFWGFGELNSGCGSRQINNSLGTADSDTVLQFLKDIIIVGKTALPRVRQPLGDRMFTTGKNVKRFCLLCFSSVTLATRNHSCVKPNSGNYSRQEESKGEGPECGRARPRPVGWD